jgi:hypothetical protein
VLRDLEVGGHYVSGVHHDAPFRSTKCTHTQCPFVRVVSLTHKLRRRRRRRRSDAPTVLTGLSFPFLLPSRKYTQASRHFDNTTTTDLTTQQERPFPSMPLLRCSKKHLYCRHTWMNNHHLHTFCLQAH